VIDTKTLRLVDLIRSIEFVRDVTSSLQRFAVATETHIMIWSLPGRNQITAIGTRLTQGEIERVTEQQERIPNASVVGPFGSYIE
jgi:hypothetical protein